MSTTESDPTRKQWEYMQIARKTEEYLVNDLNKLGQDGWEMIAVSRQKQTKSGIGASEAWVAFLKRPYTGEVKARAAMEKAKDIAAPPDDQSTDADVDVFDFQDD